MSAQNKEKKQENLAYAEGVAAGVVATVTALGVGYGVHQILKNGTIPIPNIPQISNALKASTSSISLNEGVATTSKKKKKKGGNGNPAPQPANSNPQPGSAKKPQVPQLAPNPPKAKATKVATATPEQKNGSEGKKVLQEKSQNAKGEAKKKSNSPSPAGTKAPVQNGGNTRKLSTASSTSSIRSTSTTATYSSRSGSLLESDPIIIATDATEDIAGGFLLLPSTKEIFYYSIKWSTLLTFKNKGEKPEVVNAFLGLEIFGQYIRRYRKKYFAEINVKMSSKCLGTGANGIDKANKSLFQIVDTKLPKKGIQANWIFVQPNVTDTYAKIAEKLSRCHMNLTPATAFLSGLDSTDLMTKHKATNLSVSDYAVLHTVTLLLPELLKSETQNPHVGVGVPP